MEFFYGIFRTHPELAFFLTLAIGFQLGKIKIGNFVLGPMLGSLFAGMIVGLMNISVDPMVKSIFFSFFLFATGYKVGPQFFYGLKKDALPQLILTVVICVTCLLTAYLVAKLMGMDVGTAAGLLAGAFSESTVIGTAGDAIMKLPLSEEERVRLVNKIPVAYAVTYLVGTTTIVWLLSSGIPKMLRINLSESSRQLAETLEGGARSGDDLNSAFKEWGIRCFRLDNHPWIGMSVASAVTSLGDVRIFIQRVRQNGKILEPDAQLILGKGDIVAVSARQSVLVDQLSSVGEEVVDRDLLDFPMEHMELMITRKSISGRTLRDLATEYGHGIMLNRLVRGGEDLPFAPGTRVQEGDILHVTGRKVDVDRASVELGFKKISTSDTDIFFVGLGVVLGGLVGLLAFSVGGVMITLSTSGGALVMGLVFGWLHSKTPRFGRIPEPALWIFDNLGLAAFLAVVGLNAGPTFISGLKETGLGIIPAGVAVAVIPHLVGLLVGRYLLKMHPVIQLGAQAGGGTSTTALKAIQDVSASKMAVLGYTIPYAMGNIILTAWGPVIVSLMT